VWGVTDEELKAYKASSLSDSLHIIDYMIRHCWSSPPTAHPFIRSADKHTVFMATGVRKVETQIFYLDSWHKYSVQHRSHLFQWQSSSAVLDMHTHTHTHSITQKQPERGTSPLLFSQSGCLHFNNSIQFKLLYWHDCTYYNIAKACNT